MVRAITLVAALAVAFASLGTLTQQREAGTAHACSLVPLTTADIAIEARFVVVADAITVGGDANTQPTLTPTSFPTHEFTATPTPSPTKESFLDFSTPTSTPSPVSSPIGTSGFLRLQGMGAVLRVVETVGGTPPAEFPIDAEKRASYERYLREREARVGLISSCGPFAPPQYEVGLRYIVFVGPSFPDGVPDSTILRWRIDGADVVIGPGEGSLTMTRAQHARYFPNVPLHPLTRAEDRDVSLVIDRVPLAQFVRFVDGVRNAPSIVPPETGSAGLAAVGIEPPAPSLKQHP